MVQALGQKCLSNWNKHLNDFPFSNPGKHRNCFFWNIFFSKLIIDIFKICNNFRHEQAWRHDTEHNDVQHNDTQHNKIQHNDTQL